MNSEKKESQCRGKKILVVDDDQDVLELISVLLSSEGYEITSANCGNSALKLFASAPENFDLVITDYMMPNFSGLELARGIQGLNSSTPILLCTGYIDEVPKDKVSKLGVKQVIEKPFSSAYFREIIRSFLVSPTNEYVLPTY